MLSLTPSEIDETNVQLYKFNVDLAQAAYESDNDRFLHLASTKYKNKVFKLILKGEITTNGINVADFPGNPHSLGFRFTNDEDQVHFENLQTVLADLNLDDNWDLKDTIKNDVLYLKLKLSKDKSKYAFSSDVRLDPKKPHESPLHRHQQIEVSANLNAYFNFKEKMMGLSLQILNLKTKGEEPPKKKKKD